MADGQETPPPALKRPTRYAKLGDIRVDQSITAPLGGLNPYSIHYKLIGEQFVNLMISHVGLTSDARILEIGCGTGRIPAAMQRILTTKNYIGFDINQHFVDYCKHDLKCKVDNFDIRHEEFNPSGTLDAATFEFPYETKSFDIVCAVAVFNHMHIAEIGQYMREIGRVLVHHGRCFCTYHILNKHSMQFIHAKKDHPHLFEDRQADEWHEYADRPLFNVAHPEAALRRMYIKNNLAIQEPIKYGHWCEGKSAVTGPDVIIARKGGWR